MSGGQQKPVAHPTIYNQTLKYLKIYDSVLNLENKMIHGETTVRELRDV